MRPEKKPRAEKAVGKKRASSLSLTMPLARARKLAGDLYEAAGLALWTEAVEAAAEPKKSELVQLQDSICDAADFLREAKASNPRHLQLFWVACLDRNGLPATDAALRHRRGRGRGAGDLARGVQGRIWPPPPPRLAGPHARGRSRPARMSSGGAACRSEAKPVRGLATKATKAFNR